MNTPAPDLPKPIKPSGCWHTARVSLIMLLFALTASVSFAQTPEWKPVYTNISVEGGLPSSETYFVHQDQRGYIWICTDHGVVKYDGFRMHLFNKSNGLPDEVVFKIYEDPRGRVWFYLYNGTLAYYNQEKQQMIPYEYNSELLKLNHGDFINRKSFAVDKDGNLYYSGLYGTARIDKNGKVFRYNIKGNRSVVNLNGNWIVSGVATPLNRDLNSVCVIGSDQEVTTYMHSSPVIRFELIEVNKRKLLQVNNLVFDLESPSQRLELESITGVYQTGGELWITTLTGAFRYKDNRHFNLAKPDGVYLKDQKVTSITKDSEGGYWFSTLDNGIYYTANLDIVNRDQEAGDKGVIHDINGFDKRIYYSSAFGCYDLETGEKLLSMKTGSRNLIGIWDKKIVLSQGVPFYFKEGATNYPWGSVVTQFEGWAVDAKGDFYGAYVMPFRLSKKTGKYERLLDVQQIYSKDKYSAHFFKSLAFDEGNTLYAGTLIGIFKIKKGRVEKCRLSPDLDRVRITDLKYHRRWGLMAATRGKGLLFLKKGKVIRRIGMKDGLISDQLNTIHIDRKGNIYVGTHEGVSKISKSGKNQFRIFNLTERNGLASPEVSAIYSNQKGIYVGTRKGIALVPWCYKWERTSHSRQINIQAVYANGKQLEKYTNGMAFNASQKVIRFLLQTTNYKSRHRQPYKYRFRNSDPWSVGFNGELILINPLYESYQLEIRYQNENGDWMEPYTLTRFSIAPPFYQTFWFYILVSLLLLFVIVFFLVRRVKALNHKNEIRRNMEMLEQKALLAQMNPHFIFNALNSIQSFLLYNENEQAERYLLKLSKLIRMTLTNSRETEIPIQREIDSLIMYLELEQMRFKNRFDFDIQVGLSHADLQRSVPPMLIQPFVENAIIHGFKGLKEGGRIELHVKGLSDSVLHVEIIDNGHGYEAGKESVEKDHKSYGTQITSERLNLFRQKYASEFRFTIQKITDDAGNSCGTKVVVSIPVLDKKQAN